MKTITPLLLILLSFIACHSPAYISGKIEGAEKKNLKLYLIRPTNLRDLAASYFGKVIDSATVNKDGSFEFKHAPQTKEPVLLELALQEAGKYPNFLETEDVAKSNYMPLVWQAGETLHITANANEFQKTCTIKNPSAENKSFLSLRVVSQKAYQMYLAGKVFQVEDGSQILEKEEAELNYKTALMNFADSTQHFLPAMMALRLVSPENYYERTPEFLVRQCNKWKTDHANYPWLQELCKQADPSDLPILVGNEFPDLNFPMITKDTLSLKSMLGKKLTIIDLWASWCAPCRKENRTVLVPLWNEYHNKGLQIIAYGIESDATSWKAAIEKDKAEWLHSSDLQGDEAPLQKKMRIQTIPANFILNDKGIVIAKNLHGEELMDYIKSYMEGK